MVEAGAIQPTQQGGLLNLRIRASAGASVR